MQQLLAFALHHSRYGYSGPTAYHFGNIVGSHLFANHGVAVLRRLELVLYRLDVVVERFEFTVAYFSHAFVVAFALGTFSLKLQLFYLLLVLLYLVDQRFLAFPLCTERTLLVFQFGNVLVELCNLVGIVLALDGLAFNLKLFQLTCNLVELLRYGVALHTQFGSSLVHKVDGLVGEEAVADVALREFHGSYTGIVLNTHLVVVLIAFLQSTQY